MSSAKAKWMMLLGAGALAAAVAWPYRHAGGGGRPGQGRWRYARLRVLGSKVEFIEAERRLTVHPPVNAPSGNVHRADRSGERYTVTEKVVRDEALGALDLFGARGWQAVSVMPQGEGYVVLLKRPY